MFIIYSLLNKSYFIPGRSG